jgi:16S rRNA C1402 (ribose-2'-O) methylase RsmI
VTLLEGGVDIRESCDIEREERTVSTWFGFLTPREKIRRIFKKQVWKNKDKIVGMRSPDTLEYLTAKECTDKISKGQAAPEELTKLYEKVRYGHEEVGNDDVKRAKAAAKKRD